MLRTLIIDDEEATREGIRTKIHWETFGIGEVETASNGLMGVEKAEIFHPDILLCDVKMPKMNGIDCARTIKERFPDCQIIFLSGYPEKEYLRSAIRMDAVDYLEKPLDMDEVLFTLRKAVAACHELQQNRMRQQEIEIRLQQSLPGFKQELLKNLMDPARTVRDLREDFEYLRLTFPERGEYGVITIRLLSEGEQGPADMEVWRDVVSEAVERCLFRYTDRSLSAYLGHVYVVLIRVGELEGEQRLYAIAEDIRDSVDGVCSKLIRFAVGVSKLVSQRQMAPSALRSAMLALEGLFYHGYGVVLKEESPVTKYRMPDGITADLHLLLQDRSKEGVVRYLCNFVAAIRQEHASNIGSIKEVLFSLVLEVRDEARRRRISLLEYEDQQEFLWEVFRKMNTLEEMEQYLLNKVELLYARIGHKTEKDNVVTEIIQFIQTHYQEDISIDRIAEHVDMNAAYLCVLFKKETGKTINQYITEKRITVAKDLMNNPDIRLYQVAEKVGYRDINYFSKVFKRVEGMTPTEYREGMQK